MSDHIHPGLHPDADSLNAFIEGALPEHERLQCLAHLAECAHCREVVFLAQDPLPVPAAPEPARVWRRWFAPIPVLSAAAAGMMVVAVTLYLHHKTPVPARDTVAQNTAAPPVPALLPEIPKEPQVSSSRPPKAGSGTPPNTIPAPVIARMTRDPIPVIDPLEFPPSPSIAPLTIPALPPTLVSSIPQAPPYRGPSVALSGIAGTVTDPSGAVVPGATIAVRQMAGAFTGNAKTDGQGQFRLADLPLGRYEVQITAPGFRQTSRQIDVQPEEFAIVASQLAIGSSAETVEVTAAVPTLETSSAVRGKVVRVKGPRPLPSKLPAATAVANGKILLAVDSAGALFFSGNAGRRWKAVKPLWHDKVDSLVSLDVPATSAAKFQLTTESGSEWLSRDGNHWYPAPPPR